MTNRATIKLISNWFHTFFHILDRIGNCASIFSIISRILLVHSCTGHTICFDYKIDSASSKNARLRIISNPLSCLMAFGFSSQNRLGPPSANQATYIWFHILFHILDRIGKCASNFSIISRILLVQSCTGHILYFDYKIDSVSPKNARPRIISNPLSCLVAFGFSSQNQLGPPSANQATC